MNLRNRIDLIPRNNWDYGFRVLFSTLANANKPAIETSHVRETLHQTPIWTNTGRTSLYAILKAMELPAGAKIGVPLFCCSVVFNAICQAGLSPCFLDSDMEDCNLSVVDLQKKHSGLAAIVAVHMFGKPCDMNEILGVAGTIPVIEDCAQSVFSTYKGKQTGTLSTASFFSFRCGKYISAGEGSAIFCREADLRRKIEDVVNSFEGPSTVGMVKDALSTFVKATLYNRPWYGLIGHPVGMRLDKKLNLTAKDGFETGKIATTHLYVIEERIPAFAKTINIQKGHAQMLLDAVKPGSFDLPTTSTDCSSNWYQFALRFQNTDQRDAMADYLLGQGIDTAKYLDAIVEEAGSRYGYQGDCPNAELLSKTILLVPIHYNLKTSDIEHIANSINEGSKII
jgi:perosamine synthetase